MDVYLQPAGAATHLLHTYSGLAHAVRLALMRSTVVYETSPARAGAFHGSLHANTCLTHLHQSLHRTRRYLQAPCGSPAAALSVPLGPHCLSCPSYSKHDQVYAMVHQPRASSTSVVVHVADMFIKDLVKKGGAYVWGAFRTLFGTLWVAY